MPCKVLAVQLGTAVLSHIHPASCSAAPRSPLSNHCRMAHPRQQRRCASMVRASTQVRLRALLQKQKHMHLWKCTSTLQGPLPESWVAANAGRLRSLPLVAGASGIIGVLLNRLLSGVSCYNVLGAWLQQGYSMLQHVATNKNLCGLCRLLL